MTDVGSAAWLIQVGVTQDVRWLVERLAAPHVVLRPRVFPDGKAWCVLLGDDLMSGVAGFGSTPELAAADFDKVWREGVTNAG